jgi:translocation and assembly module TamA
MGSSRLYRCHKTHRHTGVCLGLVLWGLLLCGVPSTAGAQTDGRKQVSTPAAREGEAANGARPNYELAISAPEELASLIRQRTLIGRWHTRDDYDPDQFEALLARLQPEIEALLRSEGYFSGQASVQADARSVRVQVNTGARATVSRVMLDLLGELAQPGALREQMLAQWTLAEGSFFKPDLWEQGKRALIDALNQAGFLRARIVRSEAVVDPAATAVSLQLTIDSGPRLGFGPARYSGLVHYNAHRVEAYRPFKEGEPYRLDALLTWQSRLRDSGYFTSASVLPDLAALEDEPEADRVPLLVDLVEVQKQRLALGAGFSTDYGARVQFAHEHRNLFGHAWQSESGVMLETRRQRGFVNLRSPVKADGRYWVVGSSVERLDVANEELVRGQTHVGQGWRRSDGDDLVSLVYQSERRRLNEGSPDARQAFVLGYGWSLRRLDVETDPSDGFSLASHVSGASRGLGSDRSFVRSYARGLYFWPMPTQGWLAGGRLLASAELGLVAAGSREDIPSENLFRAGGSQSVRGYRLLSLGVPDRGAIVGGRVLAVGTLEYQHPVRDKLRLALFHDRGNASDTLSSYRSLASWGTGLRWRTPVGPVMLDVAHAQQLDRWRVHLSVGYGF